MKTPSEPDLELPWLARLLLVQPDRVVEGLRRVHQSGQLERVPNPWQLTLGVLRMWQRVIFRSETVGTSPGGRVRATWRARLLKPRPLRFPFLVWERAIAPLDLTGLASSKERLIRHLLGAHHDAEQFVYDLEILAFHDDGLPALARAIDRLFEEDQARLEWLRDLTVFEGYHESLRDAVARALAVGVQLSPAAAADPDISFAAYLRWCATQPRTPRETLDALRAGTFRLVETEAGR